MYIFTAISKRGAVENRKVALFARISRSPYFILDNDPVMQQKPAAPTSQPYVLIAAWRVVILLLLLYHGLSHFLLGALELVVDVRCCVVVYIVPLFFETSECTVFLVRNEVSSSTNSVTSSDP